MSNKLTFNRQHNISEYDKLVSASPQGTIFSESFFLKLIKKKYHLWNVKQGTEIKAVICIIVSNDEKNIIEEDRIIYSGIMFNIENQRLPTKRRSDEFQITNFVIENLVTKYKKMNFQLPPSFLDLRPFQWFNYSKKTKRKFSLHTRYTSFINFEGNDLNNFENSNVYKNMETVRRYDYRQACKDNGSLTISNQVKVFLGFYKKLMLKQKVKISKKEIAHISTMVTKLIELNRGKLFFVKDSKENLLYAFVYIWDNKRAYYFLGAGNPKENMSWQSTFGHCEIFKYLQKNYNINSVDLEGVNSPKRGWYKLSLGGNLHPYYRIEI